MTKIVEVNIDYVMCDSYETYALEVIKDRALPDVRDGMKNVHRRIVYSSYELGLEYNKPYKKSARLVGEVLGKYHPHGDTSVYDASVRLAQDFSMRYMLLDGHGNFGSIDGDSPASMRYTEIRQREILKEMLRDINKDTVKFIPNFDGEEREPSVLPSRLPNLLVNGSSGVAVGFATEIPPHNLNEVVDGIIYQIDNPTCSVGDLLNFIKAPDFPTGGIIINPNDLEKVYSNGQGAIKVRAKHHIENIEGKDAIILTEIPYKVNKSKLIEEIYNLSLDQKVKDSKTGKDKVKKAKIPEISQVRDESDREGIRIVMELKKNSIINRVLSLLYKHSKVQDNFNVNMTAVKDKVLLENISLKEMIYYYIEHQKKVIYNASIFDLKKSRERLHILEGLKKAIENVDLAIKLIRESSSKDEARERLISNLDIDLIQANSILEIRLQRLVSFEIKSIIDEYNYLVNFVKELEKLINNDKEILNYLKEDLLRIKKTYGDDRRTSISYAKEIAQEISATELIEDYNCYVSVSREGYLYKYLRRTGSFKLKEGDEITNTFQTTNKSTILIFTSLGNCHKLFLHDILEKLPSVLGHFIPSLIDLEPNEQIISVQVLRKYEGNYLINCFENNKLLKLDLSSFKTEQRRTKLKNAISLESKLINQFIITEDIDIICKSSIDKVLICNTSQFNPKSSKNSTGDALMKPKNDSTMVMCEPLSNIDLEKIEDINYYKANRNSVGTFIKKQDKIILKNI